MILKKHICRILASIVLTCGLWCSATSAQVAPNSSDEPPSLFQLITNCPPITDLVFKYRYGTEPPEIYKFRYQSNAFYVRITKDSSLKDHFSLRDTECGRWGNSFWYYAYNPPPKAGLQVPSVLNRYNFDSNDVSSIAYQSLNNLFLTRFRLFTSLGIAGDNAPGRLFVNQNGDVVYKILRQGISILATLNYSNHLAVSATITITSPDGQVTNQKILYGYKPDIGNGVIPAFINTGSSFIEVENLSFGKKTVPLLKEYFIPPNSLLAATNLQEVIHTNNAEYVYRRGHLLYHFGVSSAARTAFSKAAQDALNSGVGIGEGAGKLAFRRKCVLIIFVGLSILALAMLFRFSHRGKK
jgi:hypothetical protein